MPRAEDGAMKETYRKAGLLVGLTERGSGEQWNSEPTYGITTPNVKIAPVEGIQGSSRIYSGSK